MLQLQGSVRAATGVASQCGKCACLAKQVVRETLTELQTATGCAPLPVEFTQRK
jgi:bacterioferritin-associated ferredoxin